MPWCRSSTRAAGHPRRKFSLNEIRTLLAALGNPHHSFRSVLIAGTNGKGSTAATLASILTASGLRAGLYTSPHLEKPNERIRVDRVEIEDDAFARLYFRVHDTAQELVLAAQLPQMPSYFEILTAQALLYFAEAKAEIAVLEVGMGGRRTLPSRGSADLGDYGYFARPYGVARVEHFCDCARKRWGILRGGGTMITLPQHPEANQVLGEAAIGLGVRGVSATPYLPAAGVVGPYAIEALGAEILVDSPLAGEHQHRNLALAVAAAVELANSHGFPVTPASIAAGIRQTRWPGRLERIERNGVEWILDVAHNPAGAWALRAGLRGTLGDKQPRTLIFSCLRDKPVAEMAQILFPLFRRVILAPIHTARAAAMDDLLAAAKATGTPAAAAESVSKALELADEDAQGEAGGVVVVSGSVYLVGEARTLLLSAKGGRP